MSPAGVRREALPGGPADAGSRADRRAWIGVGLLVLALALTLAGLWPQLDGPWDHGWLGHNGARYAQIARNYARDGWWVAGGAPRFDVPGADPAAPQVYAHHPPGLPLLVSLVFLAVGEGERPARLVSAAATLASLGLIFALVRRVAGTLAGGLAALLVAATPMTVVYGSHVEVQGPPVLAAGLGVLWAYDRARRGGSWWPWLALAGLAAALDWFGLYFVGGCAVHAALASPRRPGLATGLAAVASGLFAAWVAWLGNLPGMSVERIFGAAGVRVDGGAGALEAGQPSLGAGLAAAARGWLDLMPSLPVALVLGLALALGWGRRFLPDRPAEGLCARWLVALLLAAPLVHGAAFPAGLAVHGYWLFALPVALAAALALVLVRLRAGRLALVTLLLAGLGAARLPAARLPADPLPALVGQALAQAVPPGEVVLTNYAVNPLRWGLPGDAHHVRLPEVTWYAERVVRGGVDSPARLAEALARRPDARWFLLAPFPPPPDGPALAAALAERAGEPPVTLSGDPLVLLQRLSP